MKNIKRILPIFILSFWQMACSSNKDSFDASGSFEATERLISAQATGVIKSLFIQEGQSINIGDTLGYIDVSLLQLQADQVSASMKAIEAKTNSAAPQLKILEAELNRQKSLYATIAQQIENVQVEIKRFQNLVNANAAPKKQLDDLLSQKLVLQKQLEGVSALENVVKAQMASAKQNVSIQNTGILSEGAPTEKRLDFIEKQIKDGVIISDFKGTITTQIAYDGEFTTVGKPLYKIANLEDITLRAYISGDQLPNVKLNQQVKVRTDDGSGGFNETQGSLIWINNKAEFTPKTIQTKNERANLVYAIKVKVKNDGRYKIGMYGEIKL